MKENIKFITYDDGNLISAVTAPEADKALATMKRFVPDAKLIDAATAIDPKLPVDAQIEKLFTLSRISAEPYGYDGKTVSVEIMWGDWKHDHLCADDLMSVVFGATKVSEDVTEEDGSDAYSAVHTYEFKEV